MNPFTFSRATRPEEAVAAVAKNPHAAFVAGGTTLVDLLRLDVMTPSALVDVNALPLGQIETLPGGNLLQRTRCYYFRDAVSPCNKRQPGSGCAAIGGYDRIHAVLGTSDKCIATFPGDMPVAMAALDAVVHTRRPNGTERAIPLADFHVSYGDRASYEFALASAAVALDLERGDRIRAARVALGGVATKPWRSQEAEKVLTGAKAEEATFRAAAEAALKDARPQRNNGFKIELAKRTLTRALAMAAEMKV
jgi:xanthine dehydrogenase YagS FAD-binding subunit